MDINVLDNIVPLNLLDKYNEIQLSYLRTRADVDHNFYFTVIEYGQDYNNKQAEINFSTTFLHKEAEDIWRWFKEKTNIQDNNLESCYVNGMSYGDEGYAHQDGNHIVTCIFYMNNPWHSQWSGETVFYSGDFISDYSDKWYYEHEIIKSVLPRYGRILLFDGKVPHSVKPLSKKCLMVRKTFMLKLVNTTTKHILDGLNNAA